MEANTKKIVVLTCLMCLMTLVCTAQKKAVYDMPSGLPEKNQKQFIQFFTEGEAYYKISCAECHNIKEKKKTVYPHFTEAQLELYIMRIKNPEHTNRLTMKDISDEELQKIMHFLKYLKKT